MMADAGAPGKGRAARWALLAAAILPVLVPVLAVFLQVRRFPFLDYDDNAYLTHNPRVAGGLTAAGVRWAWTSFDAANWHPLTWISHMLDISLFGLDPGPHHLVNVGVHLAGAVLLFFVAPGPARQCLGGVPGRGDLLRTPAAGGIGSLGRRAQGRAGAVLLGRRPGAYVRYCRKPSLSRYWLTALLLALGLAAKPTLVTLPFALLLLDWWPLGRWQPESRSAVGAARLLLEKVPLLALVAAAATLTYRAQAVGGAVRNQLVYPFGVRVANALTAPVEYLGKTFWPSGLAYFYPHPLGALPAWRPVAAGLLLGLLLAGAWALRRRLPQVIFGLLWFVGTLVPVLGFVQVGSQRLADRYTLIPHVGLVLALAAAVDYGARTRRLRPLAAAVPAAAIIAVLAVLAHRRTALWRDEEVLVSQALAVTDDNWMARNHLGQILLARGDLAAARVQIEAALKLQPTFAEALTNLSVILYREGSYAAAAQAARRALATLPEFPKPATASARPWRRWATTPAPCRPTTRRCVCARTTPWRSPTARSRWCAAGAWPRPRSTCAGPSPPTPTCSKPATTSRWSSRRGGTSQARGGTSRRPAAAGPPTTASAGPSTQCGNDAFPVTAAGAREGGRGSCARRRPRGSAAPPSRTARSPRAAGPGG